VLCHRQRQAIIEAFRALVADQPLHFVSNRNMKRMFNVMASVSAPVPGTFIVKQTWDAVAGIVSTQAKAQVPSILTQAGASAGISNPQEMQNDLQGYVLRVKTAAHTVAADVRDAPVATSMKDAIAANLRRGRFFASAPTSSLIPDIQRAADAIELSWYMVMVMKSDYIQEHTINFKGPATSTVGATWA